MNVLRILSISAILAFASFFVFGKEAKNIEEQTKPEQSEQASEVSAAVETVELDLYTVQEGDVFASILESWGIPYETMLSILDTASSTYDFTNLRVGRELRYKVEAGNVTRLEYDIDTERAAIVEYKNGEYTAHREKILYETTRTIAQGRILSSLFEAGLEAGVDEATILDLAEVFAWEIDFATEIQTGDRFEFLYDKRTRDGKAASSGIIHAARFITSGVEHLGFYFQSSDGLVQGYYNEKGESLTRQFLKAPLTYNRISSGYTYARFHPTLGRTAPHLAIDYAAPAGTPVLSVGDGTITFAAWNGGYGRFAVVHHNDVYTTRYAHLSGFAKGIRPGVKVQQGQVIGYVGSTGFSTGPHLHYEIMKNGSLVNPLKVELPAGDPLPAEYKEVFETEKQQWLSLLGSTSSQQTD